MSEEHRPAGDPLREAAEWFAALQDQPSAPSDLQRWRQWVDAHPENAAAWQRVERLSAEVGQIAPRLDRRAAQAAFRAAETSQRRRHLRLLGVAATAGVLGFAGLREEPWQRWTADHRTGIGERLQARLPDGAALWLNTDSAVKVAFDGRQRRVELLRGELHIETAADPQQPARPFVVEAEEGLVHPVGTSFSVYRRPAGCEVAVFRGSVRIQPRASGNEHLVAAGRQVAFQATAVGREVAAQIRRQAWVGGMLVADDIRLATLVEELARHQRGYLACAPEVADLRVVGTYPLDEPERIFQALERSLPIRVLRPLPWWVRIDAA